jgi:hypothetical protein
MKYIVNRKYNTAINSFQPAQFVLRYFPFHRVYLFMYFILNCLIHFLGFAFIKMVVLELSVKIEQSEQNLL